VETPPHAAGYYWLCEYGHLCRGMTVVVHCDNKAVVGMLRKLWGPDEYTPLLLEMRRIMIRLDVELDVQWISTHDNTLADLLSRGRVDDFAVAARAFRALPLLHEDSEDWCLARALVEELDREYTFQVDACADMHRANAQFSSSWTALENCLLMRWHGLRVYCNAPFSMLLRVLQRFLQCKGECPVGTSALFIVPVWRDQPFYKLLEKFDGVVFECVRRWPQGAHLFTSPVPAHRGSGREFRGATRWPTEAWYAKPAATFNPYVHSY
jgi:hypothetical protein